MKRVRTARHEGGWDVERGHHRRAKLCLERLEDVAVRRNAHLADVSQSREQGRNQAVDRQLLDEYQLLSEATIVFSAMAVEGFLNFYGVVRLGESFYVANYERLGIIPKLSALVSTCLGELLEPSDDLVRLARQLSERRNALVHPKARELDESSRWSEPPQRLQDARDSVNDMVQFFQLFTAMDSQAEWMMY